MSATPTQIRKLAELLTQPADDVDTLAAEVWQLVEELQASRDRYLIFAYHPQFNIAEAVGPYNTDNQARKDAINRIVQTGGTQARIIKLKAPQAIDNGAASRLF